MQETELRGAAAEFGLTLQEAGPDVSAVLDGFSPAAGHRLDIFFLSTLDAAPGYVEDVLDVAGKLGYAPERIGVYIQPQHQGVSQHVEFTIPYLPEDTRDAALARNLFSVASEQLIAKGAYFSRPYGPWADLVYSRDATATRVLRTVKQIVDPNHVMNPAKLCY